ncbi:MAG: hypothetical protein AAF682_30200 [Planctomycetota bacterium]
MRRSQLRPIACLLALLPALPATASLAPPAPPADGGSLEELLREVRKKRLAAMERLEAPVTQLLERLSDAPVSDKSEEVKRIKGSILALGKEAAPLLVDHIDPGAAGGSSEKRLARRVADVLEQLPTSAVTAKLITVARGGSKSGRENAMRVLGSSPDRARASACLADLFRTSQGALRTQAVQSLARLGGGENEALLLQALSDSDTKVLQAVLTALTEVGSTAGRARVRELSSSPSTAAPIVPEILAYYRAIADEVEDEDVEALVRLAAHDAPSDEDRIQALNTIPALAKRLDTKARKLFEPLLNEPDDELREAAEICLALLGDRNKRKDLIARYKALVDRDESWGGAHEQLAELYLRLREYGESIKAYKQAIKTYKNQGRNVSEDVYIELARAYSLDSNVKKAYESLGDASLTRSRLRALAKDPDFRLVAEHNKYGKIFDV